MAATRDTAYARMARRADRRTERFSDIDRDWISQLSGSVILPTRRKLAVGTPKLGMSNGPQGQKRPADIAAKAIRAAGRLDRLGSGQYLDFDVGEPALPGLAAPRGDGVCRRHYDADRAG